jgi:hypothetical protein
LKWRRIDPADFDINGTSAEKISQPRIWGDGSARRRPCRLRCLQFSVGIYRGYADGKDE